MSLRLFGLTGGIGSGKSTVGRRFAERGLPVIDADQLAREVVSPGSEGLARVVEHFGREILQADGALDRQAVAARVFQDPAARRALNAITHPLIGALSAQRTRELEAAGQPLACYEVPLLFENRLEEALRPVIVVTAPLEARIARTCRRDSATPEQVRARIDAQIPLEDKVARADFVIDNGGTEAETITRADRVLDAICEALGVPVSRYPAPA